MKINKINKGFCQAFALAATVMAGVMGFASCELESSDNGDLDGYWHLESIDSLENGHTADLSKLHVFWGVEYKLISVRDTDHDADRYYFRFDQTSDSLKITQVYLDHGHQDKGDDGGDHPLDEVTESLRYYGINQIPDAFRKEVLNSSKMVLRNSKLRLTFKKF